MGKLTNTSSFHFCPSHPQHPSESGFKEMPRKRLYRILEWKPALADGKLSAFSEEVRWAFLRIFSHSCFLTSWLQLFTAPWWDAHGRENRGEERRSKQTSSDGFCRKLLHLLFWGWLLCGLLWVLQRPLPKLILSVGDVTHLLRLIASSTCNSSESATTSSLLRAQHHLVPALLPQRPASNSLY